MNNEDIKKRISESLIKSIKEGKYIDENSNTIKFLKENSKTKPWCAERLKHLDPIFVEQKLVEQWKMNYRLYEIIMNQLNIIDTKFPHPCRICGHEFATATKSWKCPTHFAKLRCSNCNAWFQWISEEDFKSRTTKYTRKLNNLGEFDDINDALGI